MTPPPDMPQAAPALDILPVRRQDLEPITLLDEDITGIAKAAYWQQVHAAAEAEPQRVSFLVARQQGRLVGFAAGEIRAWEFGSAPCGWVLAISVHPEARLGGIGTQLLDSLSDRFRAAGVTQLRAMAARDSQPVLAFFRSRGMMAGPFVELEKDLRA